MKRSLSEPTFVASERDAEIRFNDEICLTSLAEAANELRNWLDLDQALAQVAARVLQGLQFDTFAVLLLDDGGREPSYQYGEGFPEEVIRHWKFGVGKGLVGEAARSGQSVIVQDVRQDSRYIDAGGGVVSEAAIPLTVKKRTIGVLDVGSRVAGFFTEPRRRALELLATNLAISLENSRLYQNVSRQSRSLSLLHEVSHELASILDRDQLMSKVAELVKRLVDFHFFTVFLWNEKTQFLEPQFCQNFGSQIQLRTKLPLGHGICGSAAALRRSIRVPNVHLDPRYVRCEQSPEMSSELSVPLLVKGKLIGVLDLESLEYDAFGVQAEQMISTLASSFAIALENARLYEKVGREEKRLEEDLATARQIQSGLLPDHSPNIKGLEISFAYQPAKQLGGDFYDFLPYQDGRWGIVVGDVSGKATPAALYGSLAVGVLRGQALQHNCGPADMLNQLNEPLRAPRLDSRFVAMSYSVFDPETRELALAGAAFPRPWLVRNGIARQLPVEGLPLGILPDTTYQDYELQLQENDLVVLCSDGFHESMNSVGEEFGVERIQRLLSRLSSSAAGDVVSALLSAVDDHSAGNQDDVDDRTLILLRALPTTPEAEIN